MPNEYQSRSPKTLTIEMMLRDDVHSISEIARLNQVTRGRVQFIKKRLLPPDTPVAPPGSTQALQLKSSGMKALTVRFSPAVYAALVEATSVSNQGSDEPNTIEEYAGDVVMTHLVNLGLLRQKRK